MKMMRFTLLCMILVGFAFDAVASSYEEQVDRMTGMIRNWQPIKNDGVLTTESDYRGYATCLVDSAHRHIDQNEGHTRYRLEWYYNSMYDYMVNYRDPNRGMTTLEEMSVYMNVYSHCHELSGMSTTDLHKQRELDSMFREVYGF